MTIHSTTEPAGKPGRSALSRERTMRRRRLPWRLIAACAVLAAAGWGAVHLFPSILGIGPDDGNAGALLYEVRRNPLEVVVTADGNVESGSNIEVKCRVAGGSTILWIVEDGKVVEEGEVIVRLDTSAIEDKLNSQRIVYEKAVATQIQAQQDLEAAKIGVREYEEGTFVEQLKQVEADIQIALENLRSAENQLKYSKRMVRKGFISSLQCEADTFAVERAKLDLDVANTRKKVLVEFTKEKMLAELEAKREAAAARLRSEQASLALEKARLDRFEEQLKHCVIIAPKKGMVVYANESGRGRYGSSQQAQIEAGAMVRESQALVRLPDLTQMQVKVTVHESHVDKVRPGLPARVVIQDETYDGQVLSVANQPESTSWFSANVKEYATIVSISGTQSGLKPGMTAKVTVLIDRVSDALTVPVSSVVEQKGKFFAWAKTPGGPDRRPLRLGRTNDKLIEVIDGIREGEAVYRNPRAIVPEARQEPAFEEQAAPDGFAGIAGSLPAAPAPVPAPAEGERPPREPGGRTGGGRGSFNLMQFDQDGDGKLSSTEIPERMQGFFTRIDTNGDGFVDAAEIQAMPRRPRGEGGRPGGRGMGPARDGSEAETAAGREERGGGPDAAAGAGASP